MSPDTARLGLNIKEALLIVLVLLSIHFTAFKIGVVKLSEIILLLLPPFFYSRKISKWTFYFYILFLVWFIVSLTFNPIREFSPLKGVSVLKKPYLITIGRFLELIACLNLAVLVNYYLNSKSKEYIKAFIKKIVILSFLLAIINMLWYILTIAGLLSESTTVYYTASGNFRLRGWFAEGGPYGLMLAFVFVLSFFYKSRLNFWIRLILIVNILFLARSKAGILLLVIWGITFYYKTIYKKIKSLSLAVLALGVSIAVFALVKLAEGYIEYSENMKGYIEMRPTDTNIIMGRISGSHIVPKMVADNPLIGIGLGNYPIMRNLSEYRSFIPESPPGKSDAHGFGGIVQILVDGGILILSPFLAILYLVTRKAIKSGNDLEYYFFAFPCFFLTGVQIYFLYPWFLYGVLIALNEKPNAEV